MFLAHTGAAMVASPTDPNAPIAAYLVASWAPDLTGIGHWLPFTVVLSAAAFVIGRRRWSLRAGVALALLVWSHLLLDLVVGLQIWPGGRYLGLELSTHSNRELSLELSVLLAGIVIYLVGRRRLTARLTATFALLVGLAFAFWSFEDAVDEAAPPPAQIVVGFAGLLLASALLIVVDRGGLRAHGVEAAVDVDDLAGGGREPVAE